MDNKIEMEHNKIYYIDFGKNTQIIGRYKENDACNYFFYDMLHYWNGIETFYKNPARTYCVKAGIENLRRASKAEIHVLLKFEIENELC